MKKQKLRNNEYYQIQELYDELYQKATKGEAFTDLMQYIISEENIMLAYRNIKNNKGSDTEGTDGFVMEDYKEWNKAELISHVVTSLKNYNPKSVRRVEILKPNGKIRPLGIPCMEDRIIQQCIKQVIEPILESKFHKHSYGFRANRSTEHAIARSMSLINRSQLHYVVDIDIKGFFDNIDHSKLIKQLWTIGIRDKNLLRVIKKMLLSEIEGVGIPSKGTPQGGIISPLLSNVVLNELDWWISDQWETFSTRHEYSSSNKYRAIKTSNLKEMFIVRYCDDFKIFCKDYESACKVYRAVTMWLKERLGLEVSSEKSKITNIRKGKTEFLGFYIKAEKKGNKLVGQSSMSEKARKQVIAKLKAQVIRIQKHPNKYNVNKLNAIILGVHNYYRIATNVSKDMSVINFLVMRIFDNRLKNVMSKKPFKNKTYLKLYGGYNGRVRSVSKVTVFPIYGCRHKSPMNFSQTVCNYTEAGRGKIHESVRGCTYLIKYLLNNTKYDKVELADNKISLMVGQRGKC